MCAGEGTVRVAGWLEIRLPTRVLGRMMTAGVWEVFYELPRLRHVHSMMRGLARAFAGIADIASIAGGGGGRKQR